MCILNDPELLMSYSLVSGEVSFKVPSSYPFDGRKEQGKEKEKKEISTDQDHRQLGIK